jgi:hypothetical protein
MAGSQYMTRAIGPAGCTQINSLHAPSRAISGMTMVDGERIDDASVMADMCAAYRGGKIKKAGACAGLQ